MALLAGLMLQREGAMDIVRNLLAILKSLFSNPVYLFVSMGIGVDGFILGGLTAFLPKYIEEQFQQTAAFSAQIVGLLVVPAGVSAALLGGWIMKRLRLAVVAGINNQAGEQAWAEHRLELYYSVSEGGREGGKEGNFF